MRHRLHLLAAVGCLGATMAAAAGSVACDRSSPIIPTPLVPRDGEWPIAIHIDGPSSIAPGSTGQYRAIAEYRDGSRRDLTAEAVWSSSAAAVLHLAARGVATAVDRGEATVSARSIYTIGELPVLVLETGTYRLSGRIVASGHPVLGATFQVVSGTGAGLRATTDSLGSYRLYGVSGPLEYQAAAEGFQTLIQRQAVTGHTDAAEIELRPISAPADLSGSWSLTLAASPGCSVSLPAEARVRRMDIAITQQGTSLSLRVTSATMQPGSLAGHIAGPTLVVEIPGDSSGSLPFGIWDSLGADSVAIWGTLRGPTGPDEIQGSLNGGFQIWKVMEDFPRATCAGPDGSFVVRRK